MSSPLGLGAASILLALVVRITFSVLAVMCLPLNWKERLFVAIVWLPKATVQAAIGPIALDQARRSGDLTHIDWGEQVGDNALAN